MKKSNLLSMIAAITVTAVMGLIQTASAATGDQFTGTSRIAYRNVEGKSIYSIPANFNNTHTTWNVATSLLSAINQTNLPKSATWNIRYQSTANGQIMFQYVDKYDVAHNSEIFTVRHGLGSGYTWDVYRELNVARVEDSASTPYTPTGIWFISGTTKQVNDKLIGNNTDGYAFPQFFATNFNLIVEANGYTITYPLASGAGQRLNIILPLPAAVTARMASTTANEANLLSQPSGSIKVKMSEIIPAKRAFTIDDAESVQEIDKNNGTRGTWE